MWSPDYGLVCRGPDLPDNRYEHSAGETQAAPPALQLLSCRPHISRHRRLRGMEHTDFLSGLGARHLHLDQLRNHTEQVVTREFSDEHRPARPTRRVGRERWIVLHRDCRGGAGLPSPAAHNVNIVSRAGPIVSLQSGLSDTNQKNKRGRATAHWRLVLRQSDKCGQI